MHLVQDTNKHSINTWLHLLAEDGQYSKQAHT
jgi:hypothetical protein